MLVDGCLVDNVPLASMHQLKSGPNLVVHFGEPAAEMFDVDYAALPGRFELIAANADAVPQEAASRRAERRQRAVAKPRRASALRYACRSDRSIR